MKVIKLLEDGRVALEARYLAKAYYGKNNHSIHWQPRFYRAERSTVSDKVELWDWAAQGCSVRAWGCWVMPGFHFHASALVLGCDSVVMSVAQNLDRKSQFALEYTSCLKDRLLDISVF